MANDLSNTLNNFENTHIELFLRNDLEKTLSITGYNNPLKLILLKKFANADKNVLYVAQNEQAALKIQHDLESLGQECEVFPHQESPLYEDVAPNYYIYQEQVNILVKRPSVVIMPLNTLLEKFPTAEFYKKNSIEIKKGANVKYGDLIEKLTHLGYKRTNIAMDIGEFCVRGDILDIYPLHFSPVRIEFFGDDVEDIRLYNPKNQKSFEKINKITIYPLRKFILDDNNIKNFSKNKFENKSLAAQIDEKLQETGYFEGIEYYQNYFNDNFQSALCHFKNYLLVADDIVSLQNRYKNLDDESEQNFENAQNSSVKLNLATRNHVVTNELLKEFSSFKLINFDNFASNIFDTVEFETSLPPIFNAYMDGIIRFLNTRLHQGYKIFICTDFASRVKEILKENEIFSENVEILPSLVLGGGIIEENKTIFLTDKELFNKSQKDIATRKRALNKSSGEYIESLQDIYPGEFVVHAIHGVGRYIGLTKQELDGYMQDYLEIEFAQSAKLYMPAEQVNLLYRYRGGTGNPRLSVMGGDSWEKTKSKAKDEVEYIARDLLELYAKREMAQGIKFDADNNWQLEMEEGFEYTETPDQLKAIIDTKADMESSKPMDRLICADVGFGKTEIAIRATFKAVMSGYQVAIIAPTTILTYQHYEVFKERFRPFGVKVELLSSFKTSKEKKQTIDNLRYGKCDVVIGTQSILSKSVEFKKLGLLVIDEEHMFGVRQKEQIKSLKTDIDILTLSATPIPRTLNMAVMGLKDISIINTPPQNRLPIKTHVGEYNANYIKNAINNELQRDGQVFYVYNRVETIDECRIALRKLVPNAKIAVAHGQMKDGELQDIMIDFSQKKYDVLLCTTIIESGLDLPYANTIIIHSADILGLAQLYQLRGRVGRSDRQAYCYCFYPDRKKLNEDTIKRLNAIQDFTSLGSGYHIALKDTEIRGAGNILGSSQHGYMQSVGFDTYCNLLEQSIEELRTNKVQEEEVKTTINLNVTAYIPDEWVGSVEQKIAEYKRLSDVKNLSELDEATSSLVDRFSKLPESVENLIKIIKLRLLAKQCKIASINDSADTIRIYTPFSENEWEMIKKKTDSNVKKHFKFVKPPETVKNAKGILVFDKSGKNFDEIFNILGDLFYNISSIIIEFNSNTNKN